MESIAFEHGFCCDCFLVKVLHQRETVVVDWALVKAAIELAQRVLVILVHINDTAIYDSAYTRSALALQLYFSLRGSPVNEISSTERSWVAHVAKRHFGECRLRVREVVPIKVNVDQNLWYSQQTKEAEKPNQSLLQVEIVDNTSTISQKNVALLGVSNLLGLLALWFKFVITDNVCVHVHDLVIFLLIGWLAVIFINIMKPVGET